MGGLEPRLLASLEARNVRVKRNEIQDRQRKGKEKSETEVDVDIET